MVAIPRGPGETGSMSTIAPATPCTKVRGGVGGEFCDVVCMVQEKFPVCATAYQSQGGRG